MKLGVKVFPTGVSPQKRIHEHIPTHINTHSNANANGNDTTAVHINNTKNDIANRIQQLQLKYNQSESSSNQSTDDGKKNDNTVAVAATTDAEAKEEESNSINYNVSPVHQRKPSSPHQQQQQPHQAPVPITIPPSSPHRRVLSMSPHRRNSMSASASTSMNITSPLSGSSTPTGRGSRLLSNPAFDSGIVKQDSPLHQALNFFASPVMSMMAGAVHSQDSPIELVRRNSIEQRQQQQQQSTTPRGTLIVRTDSNSTTPTHSSPAERNSNDGAS
jgi:hypothetical protein